MVSAAIIGAGVLGAGASILASSKQSKATKEAAQIQAESADRAAELQHEQYLQTRADLLPWRALGMGAVAQLEELRYQPVTEPGRYTAPAPLDPSQFQFQAPTAAQVQQDPGYQFRLQEGLRALEASAASRGLLQSTGALRAQQRYGQDLASQEYQNIYSRRLGENQLGYGRAVTQNEAQYGRGLQEYQLGTQVPLAYRQQRWNELAGLAGVGQTASTTLGTFGQAAAGQAGSYLTQGANAQAGGLIGGANAFTQGLQGVSNAAQNTLGNYLFYQQMRQQQQQAGYGVPQGGGYGGGYGGFGSAFTP